MLNTIPNLQNLFFLIQNNHSFKVCFIIQEFEADIFFFVHEGFDALPLIYFYLNRNQSICPQGKKCQLLHISKVIFLEAELGQEEELR